jgi:hypothetical protein
MIIKYIINYFKKPDQRKPDYNLYFAKKVVKDLGMFHEKTTNGKSLSSRCETVKLPLNFPTNEKFRTPRKYKRDY